MGMGTENNCAKCGLLGKFLGQESNRASFPILEVIQSERNNKCLESYETPDGRIRLRAFPVCFAGLDLDIANELQSADGNHDQAFESILYKERGVQGCPKWVQYRQNLDPQWHFEEFKMRQLEQDRREFELKLTQMQIDSSSQVSKAGLKIGKVGLWIGIGAGILAVAEVLTMTEDAVLWKWISYLVALIRGWC